MPPLPDSIATVASTRRSILAIRLPAAAALAAQARVADTLPCAGLNGALFADAGADGDPPLDVLAAKDPHDAFFRVARPAGDAWSGHRRGLRAALEILDDETHADGTASPTATALRRTLLALDSPQDLSPLDLALPGDPGITLRPLADAVRRWVRGHQVFAVLTQALLLAVKALQAAAPAAPAAPLASHLRRLGDLYTASALAMRFTADFPHAHYEQAIRPAMSEPHAPAGFSGALSTDHAVLVQQLLLARPALELAARRHPVEHRAVKLALAAMYEDHKRVCGRLASLAGPSIRSGGQAREPHAAGDLLDRFQERRSHLLR